MLIPIMKERFVSSATESLRFNFFDLVIYADAAYKFNTDPSTTNILRKNVEILRT